MSLCCVMSIEFICLAVTVIALVAYYYKSVYSFWKKRNVTTITPTFPFGNLRNPITVPEPIYINFGKLYNLVKSKGERHGGFYMITKPTYVPVDPDLLRNIFSVDFNHFMDRGIYVNEKADPLTGHLFALPGQRWKKLRAKLTPTFTSGKMKNMFFIMVDSANNMIQYINNEILPKDGVLNVKYTMAAFTTDVIGSAAFGLNCNSFKNPDSDFQKHVRRIFKPTTQAQLRRIFTFTFPKFAKAFNISANDKTISKFFLSLIRDTLDYRQKNNIIRNDFLQLLIELKNNPENPLTFNEVAAQSFLFFIAGFETSSTTMSFALYEMALNQNIQEKARNEVLKVLEKYNNELTYDGVMEMKYLQQILDETLRKYPTLPVLFRNVSEPYTIPETDLYLENGQSVFIPVYAIHHDPEYYPNPDIFDPDRFTEENKQNRKHFTYMPFGEGPRNCIGLRFGVLQAKVGLAMLLKNYTILKHATTEEPIEINPNILILGPKNDILLNLKKT